MHIVTVNDYLARRDAEWMGRLYHLLGMTVGVVVPGQTPQEKREAYRADVVYGTNNEFGFDYLRDNMASPWRTRRSRVSPTRSSTRSIRSSSTRRAPPLIISGPSEESSELYLRINHLIPKLNAGNGSRRRGRRTFPATTRWTRRPGRRHLTESGYRKVEELLAEEGLLHGGESLYDTGNVMLLHHFDAALRAHALYHRDVHYLVRAMT